MIVSTHEEYLTHLRQQLVPRLEDPDITASVETYAYEVVTLIDRSLDSERKTLEALYCPTGQGAPKDPVKMLRSRDSRRMMNAKAKTSPEITPSST